MKSANEWHVYFKGCHITADAIAAIQEYATRELLAACQACVKAIEQITTAEERGDPRDGMEYYWSNLSVARRLARRASDHAKVPDDLKQEEPPAKKTPVGYYMVRRPGTTTHVEHATRTDAKAEALRLAREHEGEAFHILQMIGGCRIPGPQWFGEALGPG